MPPTTPPAPPRLADPVPHAGGQPMEPEPIVPRPQLTVAGHRYVLARSTDGAPGVHLALASSPRDTLCGFRAFSRIRNAAPKLDDVDCAVCMIRAEPS